MPILTPRQYDSVRGRVSQAVYSAGWRIDQIIDRPQSNSATIVCVRRQSSGTVEDDRVHIQIEAEAPLEETVRRLIVHLMMKG